MTTTVLTAENIVPFIQDIFQRCGDESYLGEAVTMSQHMLQGAYLAEQSGAQDELIAAALLHDIGHYTSEFPADMVGAGQDNYHECAGAQILARFFSERINTCIRHHVAAKRYLCATRPDYFQRLSEASKATLALQGGAMSEDEVAKFAAQPFLADIIQVRLWDDQGKNPDQTTPDFTHYQPLLEKLVKQHVADGAR